MDHQDATDRSGRVNCILRPVGCIKVLLSLKVLQHLENYRVDMKTVFRCSEEEL